MFIDSHCHIYLPEFDSDRKEMIGRAENEGVVSMLLPAIDKETHGLMLETEKSFEGKCHSMMGLHPCSVKENFRDELKIAREHFEKRSFIAVGETGLDFFWDLTFVKEQFEAFHKQIEWALSYHIPVVIHSRNSLDECIKVITEHQKGALKGVFHCFSGTLDQANRIMDLGFYLGIGGVVTFKNSGLDKIMETVDMKHVVLETDAPYLAPVPFRGKRNECSYLALVAEKLAGIKNITKEEVAAITTNNTKYLFNI
ncbi:MAG TPA: TatD family hydrolase [Chitinophagaceae bacterium]|nr:TatD family hydrolase [Chitinophagaceae bacterium]